MMISILGHTVFLLTTLAFMVKEILLLRSLAILASIADIIYSYYAQPDHYAIPIFWNLIFIGVNSYHIVLLLKKQRSFQFSPEEVELHETVFSSLNELEYYKLLKAGTWQNLREGASLAAENQPLPYLYFIYNGNISITKAEKEIVRLKDGAWIGEMSFLTEDVASATVTTVSPTRCIAWEKKALKDLLERNPTMHQTIQSILSMDLAKKLKGN